MQPSQDELKQAAAVRAVDYVQPGMVVGLGTGSTATRVLRELAARLADGRLSGIVGVPTSETIHGLAGELGIPLVPLGDQPRLDLNVDGADEVDAALRLIKGGGGALLREKMVASAADRFIVVVDESKMVAVLGAKAALPVAVVPFGWKSHLSFLRSLGCAPELRLAPDGAPFRTDEQCYILDCRFPRIEDPETIAARIKARPGIVEHGLFLGMAGVVVIGRSTGVEVIEAR